MASAHAKASKKTRKIGRAKNRHQAHIRYRNENRGPKHRKRDLAEHLRRNPNDRNAQRVFDNLS